MIPALIEKLSALQGPDPLIDQAIYEALLPPYEGDLEALPAEKQRELAEWAWRRRDYTASLDSAIALTERLGLQWLKKSPQSMTVYWPLTEEQDSRKEWAVHYSATGPNDAIALCLALLKAIEAQNG